MVEVFIPSGHCSKSFWPIDQTKDDNEVIPSTTTTHQQPFSVYQLEQPHNIRMKYNHLGASPICRANANKSMQLLRRVLQPAINHDIVEVFRKYILVFREAAENACENMTREPFSMASPLIVDTMVAEVCQDALNNAKSLFAVKESKHTHKNKKLNDDLNSTIFNRLNAPSHVNQKRRAESPDIPWQRRLKDDHDDLTLRRSLSPLPKKRPKNIGSYVTPRRYGSPHRNTKEIMRRKIESWNPSRLTLDTEFVMGTKANRALGLGATRGRIYMKHPDLFKYAGDHEDKKWMVKNNCMAATGGKNTFLMMAEDVMHLYETEYKDSPGTMPEELQFFKLPEFVLQKMRAAMVTEKKTRIDKLNNPTSDSPLASDFSSPHPEPAHHKQQTVHRTARQAAQVAAAAINAASTSPDDHSRLPITTVMGSPNLRTPADSSAGSDSYSDHDLSDNGEVI